MHSRSIRTTTLVIPAVLLALAGCGNDDAAAATMAPSSNTSATNSIGRAYKGAAGLAGAAAGNYQPAFDSTEFVGAAGVVGAAAGKFR